MNDAASPIVAAAHQPPIAAGPASGPVPARRALVLAGGGMRVAWQAGAVKALHEAGLRFTHADGASGGTMNLAALLSGVTPNELCERWRRLPVRAFAALRPARDYFPASRLTALGSAEGLTRTVYPGLGIDVTRVRGAAGIDASFTVCRFDDKTAVPLPHTELDVERLVAAVSLPVFLPAVQAAGATWTDAVWIKDANLLSCVERGADELWLLWCIGNTHRYHDGAFRQYVHMIEMSALGALHAELAAIADINARIAAGAVVHGHARPIVVRLVKPETPLPLDPDFFRGRIDAATLIDMGYRDARAALRHGQPAPLTPAATAMREPGGPGVAFRETMAGRFSLGATDPVAGAAAPGATTLALHAAIDIEEIDAFTADPAHRSGLVGHVDFAPFGMALPGQSGVFALFAPSGEAALTYMVYELAFRHDGRDYYLAGKKHVRRGPPWRLWRETTTLYTTLHEGDSAAGPVVGAGILRLGVGELLCLVRSAHARNAPTARAGLGAIWRFVRFFAASLARTYLRRGRHE